MMSVTMMIVVILKYFLPSVIVLNDVILIVILQSVLSYGEYH
jgi:hypothetical protein